jgi:hypothetical protein
MVDDSDVARRRHLPFTFMLLLLQAVATIGSLVVPQVDGIVSADRVGADFVGAASFYLMFDMSLQLSDLLCLLLRRSG